MRQINLPITDEAYHAAKDASRKAGMLFRAWVERAILAAVERETTIQLREPRA